MEQNLLNLFVIVIIPVVRPPRPWILFLKPSGNGGWNLEILEHSRVVVANFKRAGDLIVAD